MRNVIFGVAASLYICALMLIGALTWSATRPTANKLALWIDTSSYNSQDGTAAYQWLVHFGVFWLALVALSMVGLIFFFVLCQSTAQRAYNPEERNDTAVSAS